MTKTPSLLTMKTLHMSQLPEMNILENHPDVSGGDSSGDTFVTLRGHFRTLLKVTSREKKN